MNFVEFAEKFRFKIIRDGNNNRVIQGKRGNIHEDGKKISIFVGLNSKTAIKNVHEKISGFCDRKQNGDTEAVYQSDPKILNESAIELISKVCRIRRKTEYDAETLEKMRAKGRLLASKLKKNDHCTVQ